jgi:hypothetical protein
MPIAIDGSGTITGISAGGLPDATITQAELASGVAGTGPAFSAYATASQTVSSSIVTKVILGLENFDTANCFDSTTNYRFTPNVAGYYQINGSIYASGTTVSVVLCSLYKNGTPYLGGSFIATTGTGSGVNGASTVTGLVYMNGTTDYIELYGYAVGTGTVQLSNPGSLGLLCQFSGSLVRGV